MATVWYFTYNDGTAKTLSFDMAECAELLTRQNCAVDVQQFKDGTAKVYCGPGIWDLFRLTFRMDNAQTMTKINTLRAVRVDIKFYPKYHTDVVTYKNVRVIPENEKVYVAGGLSADDQVVNLIEITA